MSEGLAEAVAASLDARPASARSVAGGDVSRAMLVELGDGRRVFVKHGAHAPHAMYEAEAAGLRWLADADALRVPRVLAVGQTDGPAFLALEWLDQGTPSPQHDELLGRGLARLHASGAPGFGWRAPGFIGPLEVPNEPTPTWAEFYGRRRLLPLARVAVQRSRLAPAELTRIEHLCERLGDLLGPEEPPARLHGDLWSGNAVVLADGSPALVDPAAYGGHREVDLAMMRLFGGFSERVHAAYEEVHPLAEGADERVALMQVLPLLVHVVLFGGGYVASLRTVLGRYLG